MGLEKQKVSKETLDEFLQEIDRIRIRYHLLQCNDWMKNTSDLHNQEMQYLASYLKVNLGRILDDDGLLA